MNATTALHPPVAVPVGDIERALASLWRHPEHHTDADAPLTRACRSNLIVFCGDSRIATEVMCEIPAIVRYHPARVLTLVAVDGPREIAAYVTAQTISDHHGHQVVAEMVMLTGGTRPSRLTSLARHLLLGDVPTSLWWAAPVPPRDDTMLGDLAAMSHQVIFDSFDWQDQPDAIVAAADWSQHISCIADLNWRRLEPWRRLLSHALDPAIVPGALANLTEIRAEYGPRALPQAWLLIGWLADRLGWVPVRGRDIASGRHGWEFASGAERVSVSAHGRIDAGEAHLRSVRLSWRQEGAVRSAELRREHERLAVYYSRRPGMPRSIGARHPQRSVLITALLPELERDHLYDPSLMLARRMALAIRS